MSKYSKIYFDRSPGRRSRSKDKNRNYKDNHRDFYKQTQIYKQNSQLKELFQNIESGYNNLRKGSPDLKEISDRYLDNIQQDINQIIKNRMLEAYKNYLGNKYSTLQKQVDDVNRFLKINQISEQQNFDKTLEIPDLLKKFKQISKICHKNAQIEEGEVKSDQSDSSESEIENKKIQSQYEEVKSQQKS
ncbi:hypothetical protein pb186bvf_000303 [Paramecium bursaria]